MLHVIEETIMDSIKMLPFLYIAYLILEYLEKKSNIKEILKNSGKFGTIIGATLGAVPQCGFSVTASSLYAGRVITLGTLISVFLATSDEAIPILLTTPNMLGEVLKIIIVKIIYGFIASFVIDFILSKKNHKYLTKKNSHEHITAMCEHVHSKDKKHSIWLHALKHTLNVFVYILIVAFVLNSIIHLIGSENLSKVLMQGSVLQVFIAGIIGLIPNCASSVVLTNLFVAGNISFASIIAGLCTNAGIGLVVLFKENKDIKENLKIVGLLYFLGVLIGVILQIISNLI